jgi:hypothetical protein
MYMEEIRKNHLDLDMNNYDDLLLRYTRQRYFKPTHTLFRPNRDNRITPFLCIPMSIKNIFELKLSNQDADLIDNLSMGINKNYCDNNHENITIQIDYGNAKIFYHTMEELILINKMFCEDNEDYYLFNINKLLGLNFFDLVRRNLKITILGLNEKTTTEFFYNKYILSSMEHNKFNNLSYEESFNVYSTINCENNNYISLPNNLLVSNMSISGKDIQKVTYSADNLNFDFIHNNSLYNFFHKCCKTNDNTFFYLHKNPEIHSANVLGNLIISNGKIFVHGLTNNINKLIIQHTNILRHTKLSSDIVSNNININKS